MMAGHGERIDNVKDGIAESNLDESQHMLLFQMLFSMEKQAL